MKIKWKTGDLAYSPMWDGAKPITFIKDNMETYNNGAYTVIVEDCMFDEFGRWKGKQLLFRNPVNITEVPWMPTVGELCWFWDHNQRRAAVTRFKGMRKGPLQYVSTGDVAYNNCAPFTGELPEGLVL